jgi:hypothetical protein
MQQQRCSSLQLVASPTFPTPTPSWHTTHVLNPLNPPPYWCCSPPQVPVDMPAHVAPHGSAMWEDEAPGNRAPSVNLRPAVASAIAAAVRAGSRTAPHSPHAAVSIGGASAAQLGSENSTERGPGSFFGRGSNKISPTASREGSMTVGHAGSRPMSPSGGGVAPPARTHTRMSDPLHPPPPGLAAEEGEEVDEAGHTPTSRPVSARKSPA